MTTLPTVTIDDILKRNPCYPESRMRELYKPRKKWTALQVIKEIGPANNISPRDLLWTVLHPQFIPERELRLLACLFAERALEAERKAGREPDPRSWNAIKVSRLFADGKATNDELSAAYSAADRAAYSAADRAAYGAAYRAAYRAAYSAAYSAAYRAAYRAAYSAAERAAERAEQEAQLAVVIEMLEKMEAV